MVVEARVVGPDTIEIPQGTFYTRAGHRVEITPADCRIEGMPVGQKVTDSGGGAVAIG